MISFTKDYELRMFMDKNDEFIFIDKQFITGIAHYNNCKIINFTSDYPEMNKNTINNKVIDIDDDIRILYAFIYDSDKTTKKYTDGSICIDKDTFIHPTNIKQIPIAIYSDKEYDVKATLFYLGLNKEYIKTSDVYTSNQIEFVTKVNAILTLKQLHYTSKIIPVIYVKYDNISNVCGKVTEYRCDSSGYKMKHIIYIDKCKYLINMDKPYKFKLGDTIKLTTLNKRAMVADGVELDNNLKCDKCGKELVCLNNNYNCLNIDCKRNIKIIMQNLAEAVASKQGYNCEKAINALVDNNLISRVSEMYDFNQRIYNGLEGISAKRFYLEYNSVCRTNIRTALSTLCRPLVKEGYVVRLIDVLGYDLFTSDINELSKYIPYDSSVVFHTWLNLNRDTIYELLTKLKVRFERKFPMDTSICLDEMKGKKVVFQGKYSVNNRVLNRILVATGSIITTDNNHAEVIIVEDNRKVKKRYANLIYIEKSRFEEVITKYINNDYEDQFNVKNIKDD